MEKTKADFPFGNATDISFQIPPDLLDEFKNELRVVIRHPWVIGIPVPEILLKTELFKKFLKDFDFIMIPKQTPRH